MGTDTTSTTHDHSSGEAGCPGCMQSIARVRVMAPKKCLVQFRPYFDYDGEFGFDWMREGKNGEAYSGTPGDCCYHDIVGKYTKKNKAGEVIYGSDAGAGFTSMEASYQSLLGTYDNFSIRWKKAKHGKGVFTHITPCMSLYPQDQCHAVDAKREAAKQHVAILTLHIEVKSKEPKTLRFESWPNPECIDIKPKEISPVKVGKYTETITITCKKEFSQDQYINVYAHANVDSVTDERPLMGSLQIIKNDKPNRYVTNVVFVNVKTKLDGIQKNEPPGAFEQDVKSMHKVMHQMLTSVNYEVADGYLDLTADKDAYFHQCYVIHPGANTRQKRISTTPTVAGGLRLHHYLMYEFSKTSKKAYADYYKVFVFAEKGGYNTSDGGYVGLDGMAQKISCDNVVVFLNHFVSVVPHELMHAMGFYHSFDNNGSHVYKINQTDNMMDYSDIDPDNPIPLISTWKWQWDQLHAQVGISDGRIQKEP